MALRDPAAGRSGVAPRPSPGPTLPVSPAGPSVCRAAPSPSRGPSSGSLAAGVPGQGERWATGMDLGTKGPARLPPHADVQAEAPKLEQELRAGTPDWSHGAARGPWLGRVVVRSWGTWATTPRGGNQEGAGVKVREAHQKPSWKGRYLGSGWRPWRLCVPVPCRGT